MPFNFYKQVFVIVLVFTALQPLTAQEPVTVKDLPQSPVSAIPHSDTAIFRKVEIEASFRGGDEGWIKFLQNNLDANVPVKNKAPAGTYTVWVQFVVDVNGKVSDITTLSAHGYGMEQEVIRILRRSPKWVPAVLDGKHVNVYRKQPITFVVQEAKKRRG